jgi:hypothetical protein
MNCQRNVNSILPKELAHTFSYIVAIFIHNHFNILRNVISVAYSTSVLELYARHFHPAYFNRESTEIRELEVWVLGFHNVKKKTCITYFRRSFPIKKDCKKIPS